MMNKVYDITYAKKASGSKFLELCARIENGLENIVICSKLVDVDGSEFQMYTFNGKNIKVSNDYEVDAVYLESEIDLSALF
ncbi:MAG: hypothetical protein PHT58_07255 [Eubacteriales bacterium]|nr:hypothetical protein [Eubacteriales bacterium]